MRDKLYSYGLYPDVVEEVLTDLIREDFVNEERYAQSFARGKFRQNRWGRIKIRRELQQKHLSRYCVEKGLQEIDPEAYEETLFKLMSDKWAALAQEEAYARKHKTVRYVLGKGYEAELAWKMVAALETDQSSE